MKLPFLSTVVVLFCCGLLRAVEDNGNDDTNIITSITLERTPGFRDSRSYRITIYQDGSVLFEGRAFVKKKGVFHHAVPVSEFIKLAERVLNMHFGMLERMFDDSISDAGAVRAPTRETMRIVNVSFDSGSVTVVDVHGAPLSLVKLENEIEKVCEIERWVDGAKQKSLP